MSNDQLQSFLDDDGITLPKVRSTKYPDGKSYFAPSPDIETGILLQQLGSIASRLSAGIEVPEEEARRLKFSSGDEEIGFAQIVLGKELYDQMVEDGVRWGPLRNAVQYVFLYYGVGKQQAEKLVADPKDSTPTNRAGRRKKKRK